MASVKLDQPEEVLAVPIEEASSIVEGVINRMDSCKGVNAENMRQLRDALGLIHGTVFDFVELYGRNKDKHTQEERDYSRLGLGEFMRNSDYVNRSAAACGVTYFDKRDGSLGEQVGFVVKSLELLIHREFGESIYLDFLRFGPDVVRSESAVTGLLGVIQALQT